LTAYPFCGAARSADFYAGKTVNLYITQNPGTGYDLYARLLGDNIGRFLPGHPTIIPRNMQGAAGMRVMTYLYKVARGDGTVLAGVRPKKNAMKRGEIKMRDVKK
jgi:tripartite-type tricarboxylate transporter receptor subunit TctC